MGEEGDLTCSRVAALDWCSRQVRLTEANIANQEAFRLIFISGTEVLRQDRGSRDLLSFDLEHFLDFLFFLVFSLTGLVSSLVSNM